MESPNWENPNQGIFFFFPPKCHFRPILNTPSSWYTLLFVFVLFLNFFFYQSNKRRETIGKMTREIYDVQEMTKVEEKNVS
jgi:hypothetical protein